MPSELGSSELGRREPLRGRRTGFADNHIADSIYDSYTHADSHFMLNISDWPKFSEIAKLVNQVQTKINVHTSNSTNPNKKADEIVAEAFGYDSFEKLKREHSRVHPQNQVATPTTGGKKTRNCTKKNKKRSTKKRKVPRINRKRSTKKQKKRKH